MVAIVPAVSGPYDLGDVVVRAALHVDPSDAHITAISDPLPQIVQGIPIRARSLRIDLDRSGFTLNPTNCSPFTTTARLSGDEGGAATLKQRFQVANCGTLSFGPKLSFRFSGGTKRTQNPALTTTLTTQPGESNIARTAVTLPNSELIDNAHIQSPCTRVQFAANACPAGSVIGFARARTPLLERPLEGPVYLRSAPESKSGLPDIVAALQGQIDIVLDGKVDTIHERIRTTFETVPDAPVSEFTLHLKGGNKGLMQNNQNLCADPRFASVKMAGQNDKSTSDHTQIAIPCGKGAGKKRHRERGRGVG